LSSSASAPEANKIADTGLTRTRAIQRKLRNVEEMPAGAPDVPLALGAEEVEEESVGAGG